MYKATSRIVLIERFLIMLYLEWFQNLVNVVTTYKGQLYDPGVLTMVFNTSSYDNRAGFGALTDAEKKQLHEKASELNLVMMFIM